MNGNAGGQLSPKSVRNIIATLRHSLKSPRRRGYIASNPADHVELPKWERRDLQGWESKQFVHFSAVAAAADDPMYALWRQVIATGMRRGRLLGLRWIDVDLVDATVTIKQTRVSDGYKVSTTTPKTKAGRRTIAIDSGTVVALTYLKKPARRRHRFTWLGTVRVGGQRSRWPTDQAGYLVDTLSRRH